MQNLYSSPYINIRLLPRPPHNTLEIQWLGFVPSADFRACMRQMLHLAQLHQVQAWVVNNTLFRAMRPRDLEWGGQEILAPLVELGLELGLTQLETDNALHRRTVDAMYQHSLPSLPFAFRRFEDLNLARTWASGGA